MPVVRAELTLANMPEAAAVKLAEVLNAAGMLELLRRPLPESLSPTDARTPSDPAENLSPAEGLSSVLVLPWAVTVLAVLPIGRGRLYACGGRPEPLPSRLTLMGTVPSGSVNGSSIAGALRGLARLLLCVVLALAGVSPDPGLETDSRCVYCGYRCALLRP